MKNRMNMPACSDVKNIEDREIVVKECSEEQVRG